METASESESDAERPQVINRRTEKGDNCTPGESRTPVHTATPRERDTRDYSSKSEDDDIPPSCEPRHSVRQRTQHANPNPHADYRDIPRYSRANRCNSNNRELSDPSRYNRYLPPDLEYADDSQYIMMNRSPTMKPQTFSGNEDWESFVGHFEVCSRLRSVESKSQSINTIGLHEGPGPNISITFTRGGTGLLFHIS